MERIFLSITFSNNSSVSLTFSTNLILINSNILLLKVKLFHLFKNTITVNICSCKDGKLSGSKCPSSHRQREVGTNVVGTSDIEKVILERLPSSLDQWLKETTLKHFFLNPQTSFPKQHCRNYQQKIELRSN